jgi:hypothetical protein
MLKYLKGDMQAALAAYNAGAGNAEIWKDQSKGDPDLFLETIRTQETRDYLMQIAEFLKYMNWCIPESDNWLSLFS